MIFAGPFSPKLKADASGLGKGGEVDPEKHVALLAIL